MSLSNDKNPVFWIVVGAVAYKFLDWLFEKLSHPATKNISSDAKNNYRSDFSSTEIELDEEKFDIAKQPYLVKNKFIHKGEHAAIYSPPGIGKTYFAIDIASSPYVNDVLFIELDDENGNQRKRFQGKSSIDAIFTNEWNFEKESLKKDIASNCELQAFVQESIRITPFGIIQKIFDTRKKLLSEQGFKEDRHLDNLLLLEKIILSDRGQKADVIIIDSLNSFLGNSSQVLRVYLKQIVKIFRETRKTLIILHHTNKDGKIAGTSALTEMMDTVLRLDAVEDSILSITVEKSRYLNETNRLILRMVSEGEHSVRFEECQGLENLHHAKVSSLEGKILDIFQNKEFMKLTDLSDELALFGYHNIGSIKNALLRLEKYGVLNKADGKSWESIKNLKIGS